MDILKVKRGTKIALPVLQVGEPGFCTDTNELFIGGESGNVNIVSDVFLNWIILKTPDGTKKYKLSIDNNGNIITTLLS